MGTPQYTIRYHQNIPQKSFPRQLKVWHLLWRGLRVGFRFGDMTCGSDMESILISSLPKGMWLNWLWSNLKDLKEVEFFSILGGGEWGRFEPSPTWACARLWFLFRSQYTSSSQKDPQTLFFCYLNEQPLDPQPCLDLLQAWPVRHRCCSPSPKQSNVLATTP